MSAASFLFGRLSWVRSGEGMYPDGSDPRRSGPSGGRMARWLTGEPDAYLDGVAADIAADPFALTPVSSEERARIEAWLEGSAEL